VGALGKGDEFGLGADASYSILEIAQMFGSEIKMQPEVKGNRMGAKLDVTKSHALGWRAKRWVADYIRSVVGKNADPL
jgi:UDP-glucose 4-epimerase